MAKESWELWHDDYQRYYERMDAYDDLEDDEDDPDLEWKIEQDMVINEVIAMLQGKTT
jgi:hypothetical protein